MSQFNLYSGYYDLLYLNKDYDREVEYIISTLKRVDPQAVEILEFGSGTGVHGNKLRGQGYAVFGLERSADMVKIARESGFPCEVADICEFTPSKQYDAVLSLFHVVSYLNSNEQLIAAFTNACNSLKTGGHFIFDVWYSPAVYFQKPEQRLKVVENDLIKVWRFASPVIHPDRNVIDVNYSILVREKATGVTENFTETHPMRHFSTPEIGLLAQLCGFELVKSEEFITSDTPSETTWGVCYILKKL